MANELILIVEDNPKNLKLVRDTLQVKGYRPSRPRPVKTASALPTTDGQR